jgi:micrococcal nuclease
MFVSQGNKTFLAIILGSLIIGGFCYFALLQKSTLPAPLETADSPSDAVELRHAPPLALPSKCKASTITIVTKVIDGDTVIVEGGQHVRLLGIDADEKGYPCYDSAKQRLEALVLGKEVRLEKDVTDVDQYQRCLRTLFLGKENVNTRLVKEGLVVARFYEPDVKYKSEIVEAEKEAVSEKIGCKWK